ncbi:hypothetical protein M0802_001646 [Mischocyttarus mexicanus]|nr:hypothetical protein M0802_001646 [Mischocyttarus mexicanus]
MTLPPLFSHYFPTFVKDTFNSKVNLYWYHPEFSQSRYPPGQGISEACTLICLLVAQRISQGNILINNVDTCPELSVLIAEAMVEGNATHAWIISQKLIPHPYLNIEEALKYGGRSLTMLKEWVTLFDSHGHSTIKHPNRGLVVAQTSIDKLESLCDWYSHEIVNNCYNMQSYQYELAFLYPENLCKCNNCFEE